MSLLFNANGERVNHGSGTSLDNLHQGATGFSVIAWVYHTADTTGAIASTGGGSTIGWVCGFESTVGNAMFLQVFKATTPTLYTSVTGTVPLNAWSFSACTYDSNLGGVEGDLYFGDLSTLATEVSYDTEDDGAGALQDDSATDMIVGNFEVSAFGNPLNGRLATLMVFNTRLTLAEIQRQQFRFTPTANTVLYTHYYGTGPQPDLSGNGNNGTVTNATSADHVSLGAPFGLDFGNPSLPTVAVAESDENAHLLLLGVGF